MKKVLVLLFSLTIAGLLFSACGQSPAPAAPPADTGTAAPADTPDTPAAEADTPDDTAATGDITLTLWSAPFGVGEGSDIAVWNQTASTFPYANVDIEIIGWEHYSTRLLTSVAAGSPPDVAYMWTDIIADFIHMDEIAILDDFITQADRDLLRFLDWGVQFGHQYSFPFIVGNPRVLFYNPEILAAGGVEPPTTWDDFLEASIALTGNGVYGTAFPMAEPFYGIAVNMFKVWLWQNGGELFNAAGTEVAFDSPAGIEAAQFVYDLLHVHQVLPANTSGLDNNEVVEMFVGGQLAFMVAPSTYIARFNSIDPSFEWDFVPSLSSSTVGTFIAADSLVVMEACEHKDIAVDLIRHALLAENMERFHSELSAFVPISTDAQFLDDPRFEPMFENTPPDLFRLIPAVPSGFMVYEFLWTRLQMMMMGEISPEEALQESARFGNQLLMDNQ